MVRGRTESEMKSEKVFLFYKRTCSSIQPGGFFRPILLACILHLDMILKARVFLEDILEGCYQKGY